MTVWSSRPRVRRPKARVCRRSPPRPCGPRTRSSRTSASRGELLDLVQDFLRIRRDLRIFRHPLVPDDAAPVQDEHGPLRDPFQADAAKAVVLNPVGPADRSVPIAQERIVEMILFLEYPGTGVAVRADSEHLRPHPLEVAKGPRQGPHF